MSDPAGAPPASPKPAPAPAPIRDPGPPAPLEEAAEPRSFASKIFGIGVGGWIQLVLVCIALGAIFDAGGFNPFAPGFTLSSGLNAIGTGALNLVGWALQAGWRPFLAGALVVFPIWLVWRLISVPFRKPHPPQGRDRFRL